MTREPSSAQSSFGQEIGWSSRGKLGDPGTNGSAGCSVQAWNMAGAPRCRWARAHDVPIVTEEAFEQTFVAFRRDRA